MSRPSNRLLESVFVLIALVLIAACGDDSSPNDPVASADAGDAGTAGTAGSAGDAGSDAPVFAALACPKGAPLELAAGNHRLTGECDVTSISLSGDASLLVEDATFTAAGDITLANSARLELRGGSFTIAQTTPDQFTLRARDNATLAMRKLELSTRAATATGNAYLSYYGEGYSKLTVEDTTIDWFESWLLCNLTGNATVETKNSTHVPNEIYPSESATVRIEGPKSEHGVWLPFGPGSVAVLDDLPGGETFTHSFGRNTPGVVGIDYQVDVVDGVAGFNVLSMPKSDVTIKNNGRAITIGYIFAATTTAETVTALPTGTVNTVLTHQGRKLTLENALLGPVPWQLYVDNSGVTAETVSISKSLINELGAIHNAKVHVEDSTFQWALVTAMGKGSSISIANSVINSQTVSAAEDSTVMIADSSIYGSLLQASGTSRIALVNTEFAQNVCHGDCSPFCDPGKVCNPFNPGKTVELVTEQEGAIIVLALQPITAPLAKGSKAPITGTALVKSLDPTLASYHYRLSYRAEAASSWTEIVANGAAPKNNEPLGTLDTAPLASGNYVMRLELVIGGSSPLIAARPFAVAP